MGTLKRGEEAAREFLVNSFGHVLPGDRLGCRAGWAERDYDGTLQFMLSM